ncbi:MAG: beta-phosphoglucomutase [Parasporobacterium sp.]|nr:beta-phosphoglucomutase [Parasporobacterium sp.]
MKFDAVIFDLDGVICFTDEYHYLAWKKIADDLGIPFDREINNRLRGVSRMESLDIILEKYEEKMSDAEKEEIATQKNEIYKEYLATMSEKDLDGRVRKTLDELRRKGLRLAIGSSSKNAGFILRQIGLEGFFDAVSDGNNIKNSKPDPEVFLKAAEFIGMEPSRCLVVEDAVSGAEAGHRAGMKVAALGEASKEKAGDWNLASFEELRLIVEEERNALLEKATGLLKDPLIYFSFSSRISGAVPGNEGVGTVLWKEFSRTELKKKERVYLDFGNHFVGYLSLNLSCSGSHPDAPVLLKVRFAERFEEFGESREDYQGWICSSWVQEELLHVDVIPGTLTLPRRYAFRFVEIEIVDISSKFTLVLDQPAIKAVSGADDSKLTPYEGAPDLARIDEISCRTLHNCMQTVFEDGPKRDRRLWMGDLRLQALSNYETYKNYDMVKACLYLFAALPLKDGKIAAGIFLEPKPEADDQSLFDYSLLYIPTLLDYYLATGDLETLRELSDIAFRQIDLALKQVGEDGIVRDSDQLGWCFLDWSLDLNKQAGAQGVLLYAINEAKCIAELLGEKEKKSELTKLHTELSEAARKVLWDGKRCLFKSGAEGQISWASQIWMVLGGAVEKDLAHEILIRLPDSDALKPVTPYMYHHYVSSLIQVSEDEKALEVIRNYWGAMADQGFDTFPELYNPENPLESPYGGTIVNSYCHAWSCTPSYFLRKYFGN